MNKNIFSSLYNSESDDESEKINEQTNFKKKIELKNVELKKNVNLLDKDGWTVVGLKSKNIKYNKNNINLWYSENNWQTKLIKNLFKFKDDNSSVLEKYDLLYLNNNYSGARNNYYRNRCIMKMMLIITEKEWDNIKDLVYENN